MKRYALFCGAYNLMMGGIKDFKQSFHTEEEAIQEAENIAENDPFVQWVQIFDKKLEAAKTYSAVRGKLKRRKEKESSCNLEAMGAS